MDRSSMRVYVAAAKNSHPGIAADAQEVIRVLEKAFHRYHGLECFQRLQCPLETNRSWRQRHRTSHLTKHRRLRRAEGVSKRQ